MRKSSVIGVSGQMMKATAVGVFASAMFISSHNEIAYQDVVGASVVPLESRWLAHIKPPVSTTTKQARMVSAKDDAPIGVDNNFTGSISKKARPGSAPEGTLSLTPKTERVAESINRSLKGSRVVDVEAMAPPRNFSAGSILKQHSMMDDLNLDKKFELAFVKPKPHEQVYQVASIFQHKKKAPDIQDTLKNLPVMVASLVKESQSSILAYAPEPEVKRSPFAAVLNEPTPVKNIPKLGRHDHSWADDPLPRNSFSKTQQTCLAQGIYFEARGESVRGQAAVSQVILNRVRNPSYPNSICGVVYQNRHWRNRCQFSFACDRIRDRVRDKKSWMIAKHVAKETTAGRIWFKQVGSSTHYHATYVRPVWARSMKRVGKVGMHIFYRTKRGGWS